MLHEIEIIGNLGRDPEMRYTPNGQAVTSFSVATNREWTNADGTKSKETVWWKADCWGKMAETANEWLSQGDLVRIKARMKPAENGGPRIWTRNDGTPAADYEVVAENIKFLNVKKFKEGNGNGNGNGNGAHATQAHVEPQAATMPAGW